MWNTLRTDEYEGMIAETTVIQGADNTPLRTYFSRPLGGGQHPGIVMIPHMPGWDEYTREAARRFTQHGYMVMSPNIYQRFGEGTPSEVSQMARAAGGAVDDVVMGDCAGAIAALRANPACNGKIGVIGMCSGGRHAFLAACRLEGIDAAIDCWGGGVVAKPEDATPARPDAPIAYTTDLSCPLLGIFGNEDRNPTPEAVDILEAELIKYGKNYEFHRYDGAGHGMWYYHTPMYRQEQAMDSFEKALAFFEKYLK